MDRALTAAIVIAVVAGAVLLMALGWRNLRRRRPTALELLEPPLELRDVTHRQSASYVATTRAGEPLQRVRVPGLSYPGRGVVEVDPTGLLIDLRGEARRFIPSEAFRGVGRATWTIDRVVEPDGLVLVRWALGDDELDSYLRVDDPAALVAELERLIPTPTASTESDPA